jgi:hypothetical protein
VGGQLSASSKENLRGALEERVAAFVESMLADLARVTEEGGSASVAGLFADRLEREPGMAGYVRRLLADGGPAGVDLFRGCNAAAFAGTVHVRARTGGRRIAHIDEEVTDEISKPAWRSCGAGNSAAGGAGHPGPGRNRAAGLRRRIRIRIRIRISRCPRNSVRADR